MSRSSNSDICRLRRPQSSGSPAPADAVIQSSPAGLISASMRACVIIPRSPTSTTCAEREALLDLVDLRGERARIGGVALEYLDRHRAAVRRAQQAVDDLQLALLAVAVVAALRQFAAAPLHIARATRRRAPACRPAGACGRAPSRPPAGAPEPVERDIELVLVDRPQTEDLAEAGSRGRADRACGRSASFEAGAISRATIIAMTRSRQRLPAGPSRRSRAMSRRAPSTAATWPCGNARRTTMVS